METMKETIVEQEAHKRAIKQRLQEIIHGIGRLRVVSLQQTAGDARARLDSFLHGHGGEGKLTERQQQELKGLRERAKSAADDSARECAEDDRLRKEKADLEAELAAFNYVCGKAELEAYREELHELAGRGEQLNQALAVAADRTAKIIAGLPDLKALTHRRRALLAEIATGEEGAEAKLAELDKEIAGAEKKKAGADKEIHEAEETAAGLKNKLAEIESRAATLRDEIIPQCLTHFLMTQAETAACDYIEAARELREKFAHLIGLGQILKGFPDGCDLITNYAWSRFNIPGFNLKAFDGCERGSHGEIINFTPDFERAALTARETLRGQGIDI